MTQPERAATGPNLADEDIHAFGPPPGAAAGSAAPRRGRWWWWLLLAALLGLAVGAGLVSWLLQAADPGWQGLYIDDEGWHGSASPLGVLGVALGLGLALLVLAVVVPLVLLGVGLAVGLMLALAAAGVAAAVALALGAVLLALALVTAPLWGIGLVLWLLLRPRRPAVASSAAF